MRSRIATVTMLAVASLMLSAGTAYATSALSTDTNASAAQYGGGPKNVQQVLGVTDEGAVPVKTAGNGNGPGPNVAGAAAAQEPRQLAAGSASGPNLPFTGLALIPILLLGVALLTMGLVLRRRGGSSAASV